METDDDVYSLEDLSNLSGYDKRAIRNFIEQGLMRGPDSMGRYARYSRSHVARLLAIKWLREKQGMSLTSMRAALLTMSQEELDLIAAKSQFRPDRFKEANKSSALQYLQSIASGDGSLSGRFDAPAVNPQTPLDALLRELEDICGDSFVRPQSKGEPWYRIEITPNLELSIRGIHDESQLSCLRRICDHLREILLRR